MFVAVGVSMRLLVPVHDFLCMSIYIYLHITLLKTYCSSLYRCLMWTKFRKSKIGKVNVAFNKVFKVFKNVPSFFSPSLLFLICDILNFPPLRRKLVLSFMKRIEKSSNVLISNSYNFLNNQRYAEVLE